MVILQTKKQDKEQLFRAFSFASSDHCLSFFTTRELSLLNGKNKTLPKIPTWLQIICLHKETGTLDLGEHPKPTVKPNL